MTGASGFGERRDGRREARHHVGTRRGGRVELHRGVRKGVRGIGGVRVVRGDAQRDRGDRVERVLDLRGRDEARPRAHEIALAIDEAVVALRIDREEVARHEPQVARRKGVAHHARGIDVRGVGATTEPRDQHARLVETRMDEVACAGAEEVVRLGIPRRDRDLGRAGQGATDGADGLAARVGEHGARLARCIELEHPDGAEALDHVAPHVRAHPAAGEQAHRVVHLAAHGWRIHELATHLARVIDDADPVAPDLVPERGRPRGRATGAGHRQREARTAHQRATDRDERARRMVQRQAAVHGVARGERRRGGRAQRRERPAAVRDPRRAGRLVRPRGHEDHRQVARAARVRPVPRR